MTELPHHRGQGIETAARFAKSTMACHIFEVGSLYEGPQLLRGSYAEQRGCEGSQS